MKSLLLNVFLFITLTHADAQTFIGTWKVKCLIEREEAGKVKQSKWCDEQSLPDEGSTAQPDWIWVWNPDNILFVRGTDTSQGYYNYIAETGSVMITRNGLPHVYKLFNDLEAGRILLRDEDLTLLYLTEYKKGNKSK
ncbi:MAG: hypothetical protein ACK574_11290 [Bacteroidota bacterium]